MWYRGKHVNFIVRETSVQLLNILMSSCHGFETWVFVLVLSLTRCVALRGVI